MSDSAVESVTTAPVPNFGGEVVIEANALTKAFSEEVISLQGASFQIKKGSFISLVGPSGCGKSTLLRLAAGLIEPTSGSIKIHGEEVEGPRTDIGMMFQKPVLLEWRTAVENVLLPNEIKGTVDDDARRGAIEALHLVGLKEFEFHFPRQLSGGMQQRVALARLL